MYALLTERTKAEYVPLTFLIAPVKYQLRGACVLDSALCRVLMLAQMGKGMIYTRFVGSRLVDWLIIHWALPWLSCDISPVCTKLGGLHPPDPPAVGS